MVFSSPIFIFKFLPIVLAAYFLVPRSWRNMVLLLSSLFFYAWGEVFFVLVMVTSILVNYTLGAMLDRTRTSNRNGRKLILGIALALNLGMLGAFKYANFLADNFNVCLGWFGVPPILISAVHLPIGISFFTFQALSYVVDIYRRSSRAQPGILNVALYISMFPQLIAGPIVRYGDVAKQLISRVVGWSDFAYGIRRFTIGIGKKVLIANIVAVPADGIFALQPEQLSLPLAWLGVVCYTLQIYFDFSGYSDMAIGLGRMFGFRFRENFMHPYIATSITNFWRRWHISLSSWFRDYLYIPLGGSRRGPARTYFNLIVVFFLCGLWHGASWTFAVWGLFHGLFLVFERLGFASLKNRIWTPLRHVYVMSVIIVGWVIFRAETLTQAVAFLRAMAGCPSVTVAAEPASAYANSIVITAIVAGAIFSLPMLTYLSTLKDAISRRLKGNYSIAFDVLVSTLSFTVPLLLLVFAAIFLAAGTYNPFIYFRF